MLNHLRETAILVCALIYSLFLPLLGKPRRVVLYYHGIQDKDVESFAKQMEYLAKKCQTAKISDIQTLPSETGNRIVGVTFDDAFLSVFENAVPILKKYGVPAGIFVPTGNLGRRSRWGLEDGCFDSDEIVISEDQVATLVADGFEIYSHTVSHLRLTQLDDESLQNELSKSKLTLEKIVPHEVIGISYPHGSGDARVYQAARDAGYRLGFTIEPLTVDCSPDDLQIGRFEVSARDSMLKFRLKVTGAYQVTYYLRLIKSYLKGFLKK